MNGSRFAETKMFVTRRELFEACKAVHDELSSSDKLLEGFRALHDELADRIDNKVLASETKALRTLENDQERLLGSMGDILEKELSKRLEPIVQERVKALQEHHSACMAEMEKSYQERTSFMQQTVAETFNRMEQLVRALSLPQPQIVVAVPESPAPIVNVPEFTMPAPIVNVSVPEHKQEAPVVHINVPEFAIPAPIVNVEQLAPVVNVSVPEFVMPAPVVNMQVPEHPTIVNVTVPSQPAPVVNVAAQDVAMPAPIVNVNMPKRVVTKHIQYDEHSRPAIIVEREEGEQ